MRILKHKSIRIVCSLLILISMLFLSSCNEMSAKKIVLADAGWQSIRFHNEVAKLILEHGYDYQVDVINGSTSSTFLGLRQGDIDVYMEVWTQNIPELYQKALQAGEIKKVSVNFNDNRQGLYVPTYVIKGDPSRKIKPMAPDLKSVRDLSKYWHLFKDPSDKNKGRIYGPPTGWSVYKILEQKMKTYGLEKNMNFFAPGSDTALTTSLTKAYEKGEPWVGYYWEPTWVMGKYDMTLLEEPKYNEKVWNKNYGTEFPTMDVVIAVHKDVEKRHPEVIKFLKQYKTSSQLTNEALAYMQEHDADEQEAARWWMKKHMDLWTKWVPKDVAEKVKKKLE